MWDKKRKLIWIAGGLLMGTYVAYSNSITDDGEFVVELLHLHGNADCVDYGWAVLLVFEALKSSCNHENHVSLVTDLQD